MPGLRPSSSLSVGRQVMVIAAVVAVTMLGNLRLQASELRSQADSTQRPSTIAGSSGAERDSVQVKLASAAPVDAIANGDVDPIDANEANIAADDDEARLVPAIYAWDPDVRFVYFRHVSKWM